MSLISEQFKLAVLRNAVFVGVVGIVLLLAGGLAALYLGSSIGFLMIGAAVFGGFYGGAMLLDVGEKSGREKYEVSLVDRMLATRSSGGGSAETVPIDDISKKDPDSDPQPTLDLETSMIALGQSGRGKSTFAKSVIERWDHENRGMIFHALSEGGEENEFYEFAEAIAPRSAGITRLSTSDADVRWDVFGDFGESMQDMAAIAEGLWAAYESEGTGYDESAKALLKCAVAVCSAHDEYGDFGQLDDVLTENTADEIVAMADQLPNSAAITATLKGADLDPIYQILMGNMQNLLLSDLFDDSLPTWSITDYFENPTGYVVIDNKRSNEWANPFWRFLLSVAIKKSMERPQKQYFVLDEVDKLPRIDDLDKLASAGRSANAQGVVIAQDISQIREIYGENKLNTIFGNSPNRAIFQPGDPDTAEYVMQSLGKAEMTEQSISSSVSGNRDGINPNVNRQKSRREKYPITENELLSMEKGEALVVSPDGWWLANISEPELPERDRPALEDPDPKQLEEPDWISDDDDDNQWKEVSGSDSIEESKKKIDKLTD
jgi:hypothetical protein